MREKVEAEGGIDNNKDWQSCCKGSKRLTELGAIGDKEHKGVWALKWEGEVMRPASINQQDMSGW